MSNTKGYKAFKKGMICAPDEEHVKQYAENTTYEEEGGSICNEGMMHYCVNPFDVLDYYPLIDDKGEFSDFAEVEALETPVTDDNKKYATKKLHIGAKLSFKDFVKAGIDFLYEKTVKDMPKDNVDTGNSAKIGSSGDSAQIGSSGNSAKIGSSGNSAKIGSSGNYAQIGSSGNYAQIGSSGNYAQIGSSGDYAQIGSSGNSAKIGSSGYSAKIGSSGNYAQIGSSGNYAQIGSSGNYAKITIDGTDSVAAAVGIGSVIKAKIGNWITLAEWVWSEEKERYIPVCVKSALVDGETLKPDVCYKLENGEFVEVQ